MDLHRDSIRNYYSGDIVILGAGDGIPADRTDFRFKGLFVNEATLTGERLYRAKMAW